MFSAKRAGAGAMPANYTDKNSVGLSPMIGIMFVYSTNKFQFVLK